MSVYLIAGLGNPGKDYDQTRHNVGFMFIDFLNSKFNGPQFTLEKKFNSEITSISINSHKILLTKPQTYMNNSGESIVQIKKYFDIENSNILIVHDDLDINLGEYKIQLTKGPRQHNGIISVENHLHTNEFYKIRIGIENRGELRRQISGRDYVLSRFKTEEQEALIDLFETIYKDLSSRIVVEV